MTVAIGQKVKLDIACGQNRQDGFHGVDIVPGLYDDVDYTVHDLSEFPWPFEDDSVEEVFVSHYVEHTPDLIAFVNELYRILEPDGRVKVVHPYCRSNRAFQDPTHTRFIPEETWHYFTKSWREDQKLDHYPITADFEVVNIGAAINEPWTMRSQEAQMFAAQHYWNVVSDLSVELKALK